MEIDSLLDKLDLSEPKGYGDDYTYVSLRVKKDAAKVIEGLSETDKVQEKIIRKYIKDKFELIQTEIGMTDETVVRYQAMCIRIKDQLEGISDTYDETLLEIEAKLEKRGMAIKDKLFKPFQKEIDQYVEQIEKLSKVADALDKKITSTEDKFRAIPNLYTLTEIMRVAGEWDKLSDKSRTLLAPLFSSEK